MLNEIKNYQKSRSSTGRSLPFPLDSVLFFIFILELQLRENIKGGALELGVEHGGSAFCLIEYQKEIEGEVDLVDIKISDEFVRVLEKMPEYAKKNVNIFEHSTRSPFLDCLSGNTYRFIHIDAGHDKESVADDAKRFTPLLSDEGVLCFDDFFEIRWPGVTEAIMSFLPNSNIVPFALVDRKLYCCKRDAHPYYSKILENNLPDLDKFASFRTWVEPMFGIGMRIIKIDNLKHIYREVFE